MNRCDLHDEPREWCGCPGPAPKSYLIADGEADPKGWLLKNAIREVADMRSASIRARLRHPRKAYVKVMRPGKRMPPVVVAHDLVVKGPGHVDAGSGEFLIYGKVRFCKSMRSFSWGGSTWNMFGGFFDFWSRA